MTNKITKEFLFTELSIKITTLDMKLNKPEVTIDQDIRFVAGKPGHGSSYIGIIDGPWACPDVTPNCIEGAGPCKCSDNFKAKLQSDNEKFDEEFK